MNNKRIAILLTVFGIMFLSLIVYLTVFDLTNHDSYAVDNVSEREELAVRGSVLDRNGVVLAKSTKAGSERQYPYRELYSHIIGYKSKEFGSNEIERYYNSDLIGESSNPLVGDIFTFFSDLRSASGGKSELVGYDITLTIDHELQKAAYDALGSHSGSIVALNPQTGEILAMASTPSFDPTESELKKSIEKANDDGQRALLRRATMEAYPPGSTFKIIVAASMLENGKEDFVFDDESELTVKVKNYGEGEGKFLGETDLEEGFINSSNIYFSEAGIMLGDKKIIKTAKDFMFESPINLDRLGVTESRLPKKITANGDITNMCLGQGDVKASPLHLAMIAGAVANDGVMMNPYIVSSVSGPAGAKNSPKKLKECVSVSTAKELKELMRKCVEKGSGALANVSGKDVCGKTGTAEVDTSLNTAHALFIGFAPFDDPQIALCVVVENLEHKNTGGTVAAPIAQKVFQKFFSLK